MSPYKPKDKKLPTSLQQFQPKCKRSDNRWDHTDGGVGGRKWGNIRECGMQGSQHIGSLAVVKIFCRHHILRLLGELQVLHTIFWQGSRKSLPARKHLGNEISFQIYSSDLLLFLWNVKMWGPNLDLYQIPWQSIWVSPSVARELLQISSSVILRSESGSSREPHTFYITAINGLIALFWLGKVFPYTKEVGICPFLWL